MPIATRCETPEDHRPVEALIREAFWNMFRPGCVEHLIMHNLRNDSDFVPELCRVACDGKSVVGAIACSRAGVGDTAAAESGLLCIGPLGVLPSHQRQGIGSQLVGETVELAFAMGFRGIALFGSPGYYGRFGFIRAADFGMSAMDGSTPDAFMVLPLFPDALNGLSGRFSHCGAFSVDDSELAAFEKQFADA